jgi:hypothetical protein
MVALYSLTIRKQQTFPPLQKRSGFVVRETWKGLALSHVGRSAEELVQLRLYKRRHVGDTAWSSH